MFEAYGKFWKNYTNFSGKSSRADFWWCILVEFLLGLVFGIVAVFNQNIGSLLEGIYGIATIIPSLAITVRRLRDGGHDWVNIFWVFLPIIGEIILIVKLCSPSK